MLFALHLTNLIMQKKRKERKRQIENGLCAEKKTICFQESRKSMALAKQMSALETSRVGYIFSKSVRS